MLGSNDTGGVTICVSRHLELCSYRRSGVIARVSGIREVTGYGIASVFTSPDKRGHGYASHMMRLLHWVLAPRSALPSPFPAAWGIPPGLPSGYGGDAQFSVLYSDIGKIFYRACGPDGKETGWLERDSIATVLRVSDGLLEQDAEEAQQGARWTSLTESDVKLLYEREALRMKAQLAERAATELDPDSVLFTFLPDEGVGLFQIQRVMTFGEDLQPLLPTSTWGTVLLPKESSTLAEALTGQGDEPLVFATWTLGLFTTPRTMVVTRISAERDTLVQVLRIIAAAAKREKVEKVEIWGLAEELRSVAEEVGWTTIERPEHLSAFKWYGPEEEEKVKWMFNEKFVILHDHSLYMILTSFFHRFCWC